MPSEDDRFNADPIFPERSFEEQFKENLPGPLAEKAMNLGSKLLVSALMITVVVVTMFLCVAAVRWAFNLAFG